RTWKSLENVNNVAMEVQEKSSFNGTVRWRERSKSKSEDPKTRKIREKNDLQAICQAVKTLSEAFARLDRYSHDIPSIRPARELCGKIRPQLINQHGTFNRTLERLHNCHVSGSTKIIDSTRKLRFLVNSITSNESDYIAKIEDIKQYLGELIGTIETVLHLEYREV
ncbi:uncharacterized protein LOC122960458, partial [Acropora millepora]|uniref:uncharacterized protein LOC122960458 n=1 Tax=Acropora millepora TaxID=45264 RepID=UPI001CF1501A